MAWLKRNLACFQCGSSDAMQESDFHYKCFSCSKTFLKRDIESNSNSYQKTHTKGDNVSNKEDLIEPGEYHQLKDRMISQETARKCGVTTRKYSGSFNAGKEYVYIDNEWCWIFNKYKDGKIISQKIRPCKQKLFKQLGDTKDKTFFGQHLHTPNPNHFVVITGGEIDMMTVMQEVNVACVSITDGEGGLLKQIIANQEWLNKWAYVAIGMDNDEPGRRAIQAVLDANVLDPGKIRVITWNVDDPNEMLKQGLTAEIKKNVWNAAEYRPNDLIRPSERRELVLKKPEPGPNTPWPTMTKALMGWMDNRITVIIGADGSGKSKLVDTIITQAVYETKMKVWSYSSEQDADEQIIRQASNREAMPLYIPGVPWKDELIQKAIDEMEDRLIIWEPSGPVSIESMFSKMKYAAIADGCKLFIIDHLKGVDSQLKDVHNEIGKFLCDIKQFAKNHKVHVILISHVAKNKKQGKAGEADESWNRGRIPTKEDAYGSSAITAWADNIIAISRNVESEDEHEASITHIHFLKTRLMGSRVSRHAYLKYNLDTNLLTELAPPDYKGENSE